MADLTGRVVEILERSDVRIAYVASHAGEKLQLTTPHGRREKCAARHVVLVHDEEPEEAAFAACARHLEDAIDRSCEDIDLELLWEGVRDDSREYTLQELGELLFSAPDSVSTAALLRVLLADGRYFKRHQHHFVPREAERVEALRTAEARRRERETARQVARGWVRRAARATGRIDVPADLEATVDRIARHVRRPDDAEIAELLTAYGEAEKWRTTAYRVLRAAGRVDDRADPYLVMSGLEPTPSAVAVQAAASLRAFPDAGVGERQRVEVESCFSIDDEGTREVDDAISWQPSADGTAEVGIHIADLTPFVARDDPIDREAAERGLTAYLPRGTACMLPERLACDIASLVAGSLRPALSLFVRVTEAGEITESRCCPTAVRVGRALTYEEADALLADAPGASAVGRALHALAALARARLARRRARGALTVERRELRVKVEGDVIRLETLDTGAPSRVLVRELMILYNELAAETCGRRAVALIHRSQEPPESPLPAHDPEHCDVVTAESLFRALRPSRLSLEARPHAGLGVAAYAQLTSPLRRYPDLVLQRQLVAAVTGGAGALDGGELQRRLADADEVARLRAQLEREAVRHATLTALARRPPGERHAITVVREERRQLLVELDEIPIRGTLESASDLGPGSRLWAEITVADPESGALRLRRCAGGEPPPEGPGERRGAGTTDRPPAWGKRVEP